MCIIPKVWTNVLTENHPEIPNYTLWRYRFAPVIEIWSKLPAESWCRALSQVSLLLPLGMAVPLFPVQGLKIAKGLAWRGELWSLKQQVWFPPSAYSSLPGIPAELLVVWNEKLEAQGFPRLLPNNCSGKWSLVTEIQFQPCVWKDGKALLLCVDLSLSHIIQSACLEALCIKQIYVFNNY